MKVNHRSYRLGDRLIGQLHDRILQGATLVATGDDDLRLYRTPSNRYFTFDGGNLQPVTEVEAVAFRGQP